MMEYVPDHNMEDPRSFDPTAWTDGPEPADQELDRLTREEAEFDEARANGKATW